MWYRRRQRHAALPQHEADDARYDREAHGELEEKNISRYQDSPAMGAGGATGAGRSGHQRQPSELTADTADSYPKPGGLSPSMMTSTQRSPVPVYSEFEGSPVPAHTPSSTAQQRYELGDSR
jgi:hypothetical protein